MIEQLNQLKRLEERTVDIKSIEYNFNFEMSYYQIKGLHNIDQAQEQLKSLYLSFRNDGIPVEIIIEQSSGLSLYIGVYKDHELVDYCLNDFILEKKDYVKQHTHQVLVTGIPSDDNQMQLLYQNLKQLDVSIRVVSEVVDHLDIKSRVMVEHEKTYDNIKKNTTEGTSNLLSQSYRSGKSVGENKGVSFFLSGTDTMNASEDETNNFSETKTLTESKEQFSPSHQAYDDYLIKQLERLDTADSTGLWRSYIIVSASSEKEMYQGAKLLMGQLSHNALEPFKLIKNGKTTKTSHLIYEEQTAMNLWTIDELMSLVQVPLISQYGFNISEIPEFSKVMLRQSGHKMGLIYDGSRLSNRTYSLDEETLKGHVMVAGLTGSGKTNTLFNILNQISQPFLVIEPAKTEYRKLLHDYPNLKVYTLGRDDIAPFRMNPFYFDESTSLQQHIDNLKVIFTSSFTMYASMPNIIEQCLNNIYIKMGWHMLSSKNTFATPETRHEFIPTLEDFYYELESYISSLGYATEQTQNIKAALLTRIKSLMIGGKGKMLNTTETIHMSELLNQPTVLELEGIADDEEKSLVIGLIMMRLYEYLKNKDNNTQDLKHLIVMEEAHRLFTNTSSQNAPESVNIKSKAVETLSQILCEVRAYGVGMVIVDQVPVKLAPDVLKNTNTKFIHRLVSQDDIDYVSSALSVDEPQSKFINRLKKGEMLLFEEGLDSPAYIKVDLNKRSHDYVNDRELTMHAHTYINRSTEDHALIDQLMLDESITRVIDLMSKELIDHLMGGRLDLLHEWYKKSKLHFVKDLLHYPINDEIELEQVLSQSLLRGVHKQVKIQKSIVKRLLLKKAASVAIDLMIHPYQTYEKRYKALEVALESGL